MLAGMITYLQAVEIVYSVRGKLARAAESETHWLFDPAEPDSSKGPILVSRSTGDIEQLGADPHEWKPRLAEFRRQEPVQKSIPADFYADPQVGTSQHPGD